MRKMRPWLLAFPFLLAAAPARAQTPDELAAARKLFAEALQDQNGRNYEVALSKYERVRQVKDTANVRYRIGTCEEALKHWRNAARAYEAAIALGKANPPEPDVVRGAHERLDVVSRKAAFLTIALKGKTEEAKVDVDQQPLDDSELAVGVWLDPGHHVVSASAKDAVPSRTEIALPSGGRASLTVQLDPATTGTPETPTTGTLVVQPPPGDKPPEEDPNAARKTAGWITMGAGGVLLVGAGVVYLLRHGDISTLNGACDTTTHECPIDRQSELTSVHKRALIEGPLAAVLAVTGVGAAVVGAVLVFGAPAPQQQQPTPSARLVPLLGPRVAGAALEGVLP
jgi:hypothetical protein